MQDALFANGRAARVRVFEVYPLPQSLARRSIELVQCGRRLGRRDFMLSLPKREQHKDDGDHRQSHMSNKLNRLQDRLLGRALLRFLRANDGSEQQHFKKSLGRMRTFTIISPSSKSVIWLTYGIFTSLS